MAEIRPRLVISPLRQAGLIRNRFPSQPTKPTKAISSFCYEFEYTPDYVASLQYLKSEWTDNSHVGLAKLAVQTAQSRDEFEAALAGLPEAKRGSYRQIRRDLYKRANPMARVS